MKQHYLMLAETYIPAKHQVRGMWVSEKMDGLRCLWDGGVSRGVPCSEVPWANTEKHDRFVTPPTATGLWSRYGQPIQAPDWFLDRLPRGLVLDGELWMGPKQFQATVAIVQPKVELDSEAWRPIQYRVFDVPNPSNVFAARFIDLPIAQFHVGEWSLDWFLARGGRWPTGIGVTSFRDQTDLVVPMVQLPWDESAAKLALEDEFTRVLGQRGEGLMLRANSQTWKPERVKGLLKVKPVDKAQARIVGYFWAERGKIEGKVGAIEVEMLTTEGEPLRKFFRMSGFTDSERILMGNGVTPEYIYEFGRRVPGERVPPDFTSPLFPRGSIINYAFRELTDSGLPKDPRFYRS